MHCIKCYVAYTGYLEHSTPHLNGPRLKGHDAKLANFVNSQLINFHQPPALTTRIVPTKWVAVYAGCTVFPNCTNNYVHW